jgi:hypothetical protein
VHEYGAGAKIERAIGTVEHMLLKRIARIGSELVKEVPFCRHLFNCFGMIHFILLQSFATGHAAFTHRP